jgi:serine/threonine protein kinase
MKQFTYNFLDKNIDGAKREEVFREIDILRHINHPNIAKIEDLVKLNNAPVVVLELCDGSLQDYINQNKGKSIPESDILDIFI